MGGGWERWRERRGRREREKGTSVCEKSTCEDGDGGRMSVWWWVGDMRSDTFNGLQNTLYIF